jgi:uncharacterized membrane protein YdjX (TVP38/TMEM64 family)
MKKKSKQFSSKKLWELVSLALVVILFYLIFKETSKITQFLLEAGPLTPVLTIICLILLGPTPIATDPIVILMGLTYGPFWGMVIGAIGNTGAMFVEYYFGSRLAEIFEYEKGKEKLPKFIQKFPIDSWVFLIFGRMIPGYGSKIISLIAGAEKVSIKTYLWTSALSGIFGAFVLSYGGSEILKFIR